MPICPECNNLFSSPGEHDVRSGMTWCSHECKQASKNRTQFPTEPLSVWVHDSIVWIRFSGRIQGLEFEEARKLKENLDNALS